MDPLGQGPTWPFWWTLAEAVTRFITLSRIDELTAKLDDDSVLVLAHLEHMRKASLEKLRVALHPNSSLTPAELEDFDREFRMRLALLVQLKLVRLGVCGDYSLSKRGYDLLSMLRQRGEFSDVLRPSSRHQILGRTVR
jgi:hypothetical protein